MEVLILLGLVTINAIILLTRRALGLNTPQYLACGLVGFCGAGGADMSIIKLLYMYNLERGKDATGILIDSEVTKSTDSAEKFLAKNNKLFKKPKEFFKTTTIIGHTRGATAGIQKILRNAHPFIVKDAESMENCFYLAMNGTITNMRALEDKYPTNWEYGDSDSLHLSLMMWEYRDKRNEILKDYTGAATLLYYHEGEKNTLWVWKDPERPLFYWQKSEKTMYISSIEDSLLAAGAAQEDVKSFEDLHMYKIVDGDIVEDTQLFTKAAPATNVNTNWAANRAAHAARTASYKDGGSGGAADEAPFQEGSTCGVQDRTGGRTTSTEKEVKIVEIGSSNADCTRRRIKFQDGLYNLDGKPFTGSVLCNSKGELYSTVLDSSASSYRRKHFIMGIMMKNISSYSELLKLISRNTDGKYVVVVEKFETLPASRLSEFTAMPVQTKGDKTMWFNNGKLIQPGEQVIFRPAYSKATYTFSGDRGLVVTYNGSAKEEVASKSSIGSTDYGSIAYSSLGFLSEDWKSQLEDHYMSEVKSTYELFVTIAQDYSLNFEFKFVEDVLFAMLKIGVDAGVISVSQADNCLAFVTDENGIGVIEQQHYAILDKIMEDIKCLKSATSQNCKVKTAEINDVPEGHIDPEAPEDRTITRSKTGDTDVFDVDTEISNRIISTEVKNPKASAMLDMGTYKTASEFVVNNFTIKSESDRRIAWANLAFLLHLRGVIETSEYKNITDGNLPLNALVKVAEKAYSNYIEEVV